MPSRSERLIGNTGKKVFKQKKKKKWVKKMDLVVMFM